MQRRSQGIFGARLRRCELDESPDRPDDPSLSLLTVFGSEASTPATCDAVAAVDRGNPQSPHEEVPLVPRRRSKGSSVFFHAQAPHIHSLGRLEGSVSKLSSASVVGWGLGGEMGGREDVGGKEGTMDVGVASMQ